MRELNWAPPPCPDVMTLPAGRHWDAVRTSTAVADWAFGALDGVEDSAAIIDARTDTAYWLVPPQQARWAPWAQWDRLRPHATVLPTEPNTGTTYVGVPPAHTRTGHGLRWRMPDTGSGRFLTHPHLLSGVLTVAILAVHGSDALPLQCQLCDNVLKREQAVTALGRRHPDDRMERPLTVHRACAQRARCTIEGAVS
ncbi:hypothetical protein [Streptomyces zagrosensis]|uniref:Uncharacterized protein n=1 Tax=Streptomyces zagrosensis TaxID=1042984 RepID=A0A7W9QG27_9ACTN|nr:hypothetical protein [Streptomyces zagrosensis]MBB5939369.1 hypothetical protein [Streptomyces zagrosensis]